MGLSVILSRLKWIARRGGVSPAKRALVTLWTDMNIGLHSKNGGMTQDFFSSVTITVENVPATFGALAALLGAFNLQDEVSRLIRGLSNELYVG